MALRITCIKNVKFNIIKIRTGCEYVRYFYYAENLNWAVQKLRLGRMCPESRWLDIAGLWQKRLLCHLCSVTGNKKIVFYDTTSRLNKLTKYEWSPSCLWSVGCQIVSVLTFLTGASTKLKREHVKQTLCSCAERLGDLAVATLPGASRSFNLALAGGKIFQSTFWQHVQGLLEISLSMATTKMDLQEQPTTALFLRLMFWRQLISAKQSWVEWYTLV